MENNEKIINSIRDIFIGMNTSIVSDDYINIYCDKHKHIFTEMYNAYRCIRTLKITDKLISRTKDHICKTFFSYH